MKTTTYNPHGWFFRYVSSMEGYDRNYAKVIREGIVFEYSAGRTESLKEMYKSHRPMYDRMRLELGTLPQPSPKGREQNTELDKARKRVIAVLFSWLSYKKYGANMAYVKRIACNAAGGTGFNEIPLMKLRQLYRIFGDMKNREADKWVTEVLDKCANMPMSEFKNEF